PKVCIPPSVCCPPAGCLCREVPRRFSSYGHPNPVVGKCLPALECPFRISLSSCPCLCRHQYRTAALFSLLARFRPGQPDQIENLVRPPQQQPGWLHHDFEGPEVRTRVSGERPHTASPPSSLNFASVSVGSKKSLTATLSTSGAGLTISSANSRW